MIKWKYKPSGLCPVQAEGWFLGYYFYFRSRWDNANIQFSKSEYAWERHFLIAKYNLLNTDMYEAGYLPKWKCRLLINIGCFLFIFKILKNDFFRKFIKKKKYFLGNSSI
jgi:hypothetical protein